jgi:DNA-directed RNA polymerase III subunit RPC1
MITVNYFIQKSLSEGDPIYKVAEDWDFLQMIVAQYVNSEMPGLSAASQVRLLCA